jgi:hypothetical protein
MQNLNQLFRIFNEMVFILVGSLLLWVALTGRYFFDPRQPSWMVLSVVMILWGLRTWRRARRVADKRWRGAAHVGGASLALVGALLLSLAWAPLRSAGILLAAAGGLFVLRGFLTAAMMVAKPSWLN